MFLINTTSLSLEEFNDSQIPKYAILSHRWEDGEVDFHQFKERREDHLPGWKKIRSCCAEVRTNKLRYVWVDTCCIDKTSSAHLSEAINSMWKYYRKAEICYVYMNDVSEDGDFISQRNQDFIDSKWFTRGWTLQELLAPKKIHFYDKMWGFIGGRNSLLENISSATGISTDDIKYPHDASIATRMSWMSKRKTTREEDIAYCLLGLFDVNMPLLYGEGGQKAFYRLQIEIMDGSDDESIFAFSSHQSNIQSTKTPLDERSTRITGLLASKPSEFSDYSTVVPNYFSHRAPYRMTNKGLNIEVQFTDCHWHEGFRCWPVPLNCSFQGSEKPIFIYLTRSRDCGSVQAPHMPDPNMYCRIAGHLVDFQSLEASTTKSILTRGPHDFRSKRTYGMKENIPKTNTAHHGRKALTSMVRARRFEWPVLDRALMTDLETRENLTNPGGESHNWIYLYLRSFYKEGLLAQILAADEYIGAKFAQMLALKNSSFGDVLYILYYRARIQSTALLLLVELLKSGNLVLSCLEYHVNISMMCDDAKRFARVLRNFSGLKEEEHTWSTLGTRIAGCLAECSELVCDWLAVIIVRGAREIGRALTTIVESQLLGNLPDCRSKSVITHIATNPECAKSTILEFFWGWFLPHFLEDQDKSQLRSSFKFEVSQNLNGEIFWNLQEYEDFYRLLAPSFMKFIQIERMWAKSFDIHHIYEGDGGMPQSENDLNNYLRDVYKTYVKARNEDLKRKRKSSRSEPTPKRPYMFD